MTDLIGADLGLSDALSKHSNVPTTDQPQKAKDFTSDQEVRWCPGCGPCPSRSSPRSTGRRPAAAWP